MLRKLIKGYYISRYIRYPFGIFLGHKEDILRKSFALVSLEKIVGDYFEFGVYKGNTFTVAYHMADISGVDIDFYAFDSFEGLPEPKNEEKQVFKKGDYHCSLEEFKKNLKRNKLNTSKVRIVKGWFDQTLRSDIKEKFDMKKASVIFIDCDLSESLRYVLDFIVDLLQKGTIIIIDDWYLPSMRKTFSEWILKNKKIELLQYNRFGCSGNSFVVGGI